LSPPPPPPPPPRIAVDEAASTTTTGIKWQEGVETIAHNIMEATAAPPPMTIVATAAADTVRFVDDPLLFFIFYTVVLYCR
jgi:hypothetical protein